jgi:PhnB protein
MKLITYLHFNGNCEQALNFYKDCLGGKILQISRMGDSTMKVPQTHKNQIMHARLEFGENLLMLSDTMDSNTTTFGNNIRLCLDLEDISQANDLFIKLSKDGRVLMPFQKTFWEGQFGMLVDQFGVQWMINCGGKK